MKAALSKFFRWLNRKLNIVETDPEKNAYYDRVDRELDYIEWYERVGRAARSRVEFGG
jgi:hypothetical protein